MTSNQPKQSKLPSDAHMLSAKKEFDKYIAKVKSGEITISGKKETVNHKLELIKDSLEQLKDLAIPYTTLSVLIEDKFGLKLSPQTLKAFCQTQLDFPKTERKAKDKKTPDAVMPTSDDKA